MTLAAEASAALAEMAADNPAMLTTAQGKSFSVLPGSVTEGREFVIGGTYYKEDTQVLCDRQQAYFVTAKDNVTLVQYGTTRTLRVLEKEPDPLGANVTLILGSPAKNG